MIRFIHTADIHFGMENYGKIDPATGIHTRLLDFQKALDFCIDYALKEKVDFFLFSGDAYKTINPTPTQQRLLLKCFLRLQQANIPLVIIVGNHDNPLSFGKANTLDLFSDLPLHGFHVMAKPAAITLETKSGPVQIVGIPWPSRSNIAISAMHAYKSATVLTEHIAASVSSIVQHFANQLDHSIPAVLAGHLTVSSGIFSGSEKRAIYGNDPVLLPSQLAIQPFDYVGLGHLHRYQNLNPNGYPAIVYSGSPERIDFGERKEEKGFCSVTIEKKGTTHHEFIKTPTRPFIQIEVKLKEESDQTTQLLNEIKKHHIDNAVVKILYHVPLHKKDTVNLQAILQACSSAMHLVSITPIHVPETREKRTIMNISMDLKTIVSTYLDGKNDLKADKERLLEKAMQLQQEALNEDLEETS